MTRFLDVKCDTCGGQKEMYYRPWCSNCNVPNIEIVKSLNLLKCFRHIDRAHYGILEGTRADEKRIGRAEIWDGLSEWGLPNDSRVSLPIVDAADGDGSIGELSEEAIKYLLTLVKVFNLRDHPDLLWEVSW